MFCTEISAEDNLFHTLTRQLYAFLSLLDLTRV